MTPNGKYRSGLRALGSMSKMLIPAGRRVTGDFEMCDSILWAWEDLMSTWHPFRELHCTHWPTGLLRHHLHQRPRRENEMALHRSGFIERPISTTRAENITMCYKWLHQGAMRQLYGLCPKTGPVSSFREGNSARLYRWLQLKVRRWSYICCL